MPLSNQAIEPGSHAARDTVHDGIQAHIDWLDQEIEAMTRTIRQPIDNDPDMKNNRDLPDSIPGIGGHAIATLPTFCLHPARFDNARQAAFAGPDLRFHDSGGSVHAKPRFQNRTRPSAQDALHTRHGHSLQNPMGKNFPPTFGRRRNPPHAHHRRHDAQTCPCRIRRPQVSNPFRLQAAWGDDNSIYAGSVMVQQAVDFFCESIRICCAGDKAMNTFKH
jgi:hypothetical protein